MFCIITTTRSVKRTNFTKGMHEQIKIRKEINIITVNQENIKMNQGERKYLGLVSHAS
jgi:hypothetical protein